MKHVSIFLAGLLGLVCSTAYAQSPTWQTAINVGQNCTVAATATDATGNVYLAGAFFGTVTLGGTTMTSAGQSDIYVAKYNPATSQFLWIQRAGGSSGESVSSLVVQGASIYIGGRFFSSPISFGNLSLTNAGSATTDAFVAKLTDSGNTASFVWAQRAGGTADDQVGALAVSGAAVYLAGNFVGTAAFGPTTLVNTGIGASPDGFVARLTDAGASSSFAWAQQLRGPNTDEVYALAASSSGLYVAGTFTSPTLTLGSLALTNAGVSDGFVAKITDAGTSAGFTWGYPLGGPAYDYAWTVAASGTSVYVGGGFASATLTLGPNTLTNAGSTTTDVYVARLTDTGPIGTLDWAQRGGGTANDNAIAVVANGPNVYIGGSFDSPTATFGTTVLTRAGASFTSDLYVAKLSDAGTAGSFAWALGAGGTGNDYSYALALNGARVYVGGIIVAPVAFGGITVGGGTGSNGSAFLASLTDPTVTAAVAASPLALAFYPNPARTRVSVPVATAATVLTLHTALGQIVRTATGPQLSVAGLAPGLYVLQAATPGQTPRTGKLLVE